MPWYYQVSRYLASLTKDRSWARSAWTRCPRQEGAKAKAFMVGLMAGVPAQIEANCAICGGPPFPECPHERQRLVLALSQAMDRWSGVQRIRY